jgi:hypothetical protein
MNLCQRGLLRAQTNALKAIIPELHPEPPLPRNAKPIGNGYVLLTARDEQDHLITDAMQVHALIDFFTRHGKPERISDGKISLQRWARLHLPNGQTARCAWKEIENGVTRNSRNVKVTTASLCFHFMSDLSPVLGRRLPIFWRSPVLLPDQDSK